MGVPVAWFFAELTTESPLSERFVREKRSENSVEKSAAWVRAEISGAKWLSRGRLRRFLFFLPKEHATVMNQAAWLTTIVCAR